MKKTWMAIGALLVGMMIGGCGSETPKEEVLKVGTNATFVPFEYKGEDGSYQGYDMDLAQAIGKELGMKVEIQNIPFDGLINALGTGQINMIASGMNITDERSKKVNFIPYYESGLGIMVRKDNAATIQDKSGLAGKTIAVQMATTGAEAAHHIQGATVKEYNHNSEAFLELQQGGADAVIADLPVIQYYLATTKDNQAILLSTILDKAPLGLAFKKEDTALQQKVEKALTSLQEKGELQKIYQKWFGAIDSKKEMPTT